MIIDSHVHLKHGNAAATEYAAETIVEVMDAVGIARSVVFAMSTDTRHSIEMAEAAVARFPDRLIPYVYALPHYERPVLADIAAAVRQGFRGIKLHCGECRLTPYLVDPVFRLAGELGVPCLVDFGGDLSAAERIATAFPETKLIVAHFGRYLCTDAGLLRACVAFAERQQNIWLDASGVVWPWIIREAVARIGAARILFGTDGPHPLPDLVGYARQAIVQIQSLGLAPEDEAMILGGTAACLLQL